MILSSDDSRNMTSKVRNDEMTENENKKKPYYKIASLEKGLNIIELLAEQGATSVSDIARALGQNRSASHRFLATLKELGYVVQDARSRYRLSMKMFVLGSRVGNIAEVRTIARPYMKALAERHSETVNLGHLEGSDVVTIDVVLGTEVIKYDAQVGDRSPAHTLAMGKAMLAHHSPSAVNAYLDGAEFVELTPKTILTREACVDALKSVRRKGYATDDEEWSIGLRCVAVPLFDFSDDPTYAISVSGPASRMTDEKIGEILEDLKEYTAKMEGELGASGRGGR